MFIVNLLALVLVILALSVKFKKSMVEMLPVAVSVLILFMYIFALCGQLWLTDVLGVSVLLFFLTKIVRASKEERIVLLSDCKDKLKAPSFWVFSVLMILITIGVSQKLITWWDDYNFWGTDVKALYFMDGFAGKYHNVQPEFGDYPPATQLMKWFFLHMNPGRFDEGLMFAGYYFMLFSFIAPVLKFFDSKKIYTSVIAGICMIAFPATIEAFHLDGCCADICMATCFGYFLISLYETKCRYSDKENVLNANSVELYGRCALALCVMSLCKNTSFIWLVFALAFTLIFVPKNKLKAVLYIFVPAAVSVGSWYVFCLANRRVAKLVSNSIKMATGKMNIPEYRGELLNAFVEGYVKWPLHRYSQGLINLSPLLALILLVVCFVLLGVFKKVSKRDSIALSIYCLAVGLITTGIILTSHLTIFATEDQYLDPFATVSSIERYGAPFGIGMLMLLIFILLDASKKEDAKYVPYILVAAFILLTTDYVSLYRGYWGYRDNNEATIAERESLINGDIIELNSLLDNEAKIETGRVLYVRDFSDLSWISHAYISYEVAPLSVVYEYVDDLSIPVREVAMREMMGDSTPGGVIAQNSESGYDALLRRANEYHADYIYMDRKLYPVR